MKELSPSTNSSIKIAIIVEKLKIVLTTKTPDMYVLSLKNVIGATHREKGKYSCQKCMSDLGGLV